MRIALAHSFTAGEIAKYTGAIVKGDEGAVIRAVTTDSREVECGDLFITIKGAKTDGHDYIGKAIANGAAAILCERAEYDSPVPMIVCDDVIRCLGDLGRKYHEENRCTTVAVTGSVGKTTTKEFISAVLSVKYRVHKTEGNGNTEIGLPLTLISRHRDTQVCVVEMGMDAIGDIDYLTKIALPDLAVVTMIGSSHLEFLKTRENICRAKMEIINGMKSGSEVIVYVSLGPDIVLVTLTDMTGQSESAVAAQLKALGLRVGKVTYKASHLPAGTVISQSAKAGDTVPQNTAIDFTVSGGPNYNP